MFNQREKNNYVNILRLYVCDINDLQIIKLIRTTKYMEYRILNVIEIVPEYEEIIMIPLGKLSKFLLKKLGEKLISNKKVYGRRKANSWTFYHN